MIHVLGRDLLRYHIVITASMKLDTRVTYNIDFEVGVEKVLKINQENRTE